MITYATEFPIPTETTIDKLMSVAFDWIQNSPHSRLNLTGHALEPTTCTKKFAKDNETLTCCSVNLGEYALCGIQWQQDDSDLEWTSTLVGYKSETIFKISLQISCASTSSVTSLPEPKPPIIIQKILNEIGPGSDGHIPVTDTPIYLQDGDEAIAAALINNTADNQLPIVYISANRDMTHTINPKVIAKTLRGLAHTIVEPNASFSYNLKELTNGCNVYGGTIGVYWPDINKRKAYYISDRHKDNKALEISIVKDVRVALTNRRQSPECSWIYLQEAIANKNYEELRNNNDIETNELLAAADQDIKAKIDTIKHKDSEIERLYQQIKKANLQLQHIEGFLSYGKERNLYNDEIRDTVITALQHELANTPQNYRRAHIISDIIRANPETGTRADIKKAIKSALRDNNTMDPRNRRKLEQSGFSMTMDGKHQKLVFMDDPRYTFAVAKTASDRRSGMNSASDIIKTLFN